jgi:hypothetical protein
MIYGTCPGSGVCLISICQSFVMAISVTYLVCSAFIKAFNDQCTRQSVKTFQAIRFLSHHSGEQAAWLHGQPCFSESPASILRAGWPRGMDHEGAP